MSIASPSDEINIIVNFISKSYALGIKVNKNFTDGTIHANRAIETSRYLPKP